MALRFSTTPRMTQATSQLVRSALHGPTSRSGGMNSLFYGAPVGIAIALRNTTSVAAPSSTAIPDSQCDTRNETTTASTANVEVGMDLDLTIKAGASCSSCEASMCLRASCDSNADPSINMADFLPIFPPDLRTLRGSANLEISLADTREARSAAAKIVHASSILSVSGPMTSPASAAVTTLKSFKLPDGGGHFRELPVSRMSVTGDNKVCFFFPVHCPPPTWNIYSSLYQLTRQDDKWTLSPHQLLKGLSDATHSHIANAIFESQGTGARKTSPKTGHQRTTLIHHSFPSNSTALLTFTCSNLIIGLFAIVIVNGRPYGCAIVFDQHTGCSKFRKALIKSLQAHHDIGAGPTNPIHLSTSGGNLSLSLDGETRPSTDLHFLVHQRRYEGGGLVNHPLAFKHKVCPARKRAVHVPFAGFEDVPPPAVPAVIATGKVNKGIPPLPVNNGVPVNIASKAKRVIRISPFATSSNVAPLATVNTAPSFANGECKVVMTYKFVRGKMEKIVELEDVEKA